MTYLAHLALLALVCLGLDRLGRASVNITNRKD